MADLDVLGIAGSLRRDSHNRALLRHAREIAPPGMAIRIWEGLGTIPLYDGDLEERGMPAPVEEMAGAIRAASAVLLVTPEYSQSIPGVLKNALDWAARPPGRSPFRGKVVAITGASPGALGTARAQMDLRRVLAAMGAIVVPGPEVLVSQADRKRDASGAYADEGTRKFLGRLLEELAAWTARFAR
ncbi:MAG TPA: NAD(P)H-dependent oxidoreductase [Anaeromyxobacteraceae bacterium]|nr:NAD(P)H-dependent oxidoreductase [Anaeromyxobacteraceae bacterium]